MTDAQLDSVLNVITALGALFAAIAAGLAAYKTSTNAAAIVQTQKAVAATNIVAAQTAAVAAQTHETVQVIRLDINHRMDQLLATSTASSLAEGRDSMRPFDDPSTGAYAAAAAKEAERKLSQTTDAMHAEVEVAKGIQGDGVNPVEVGQPPQPIDVTVSDLKPKAVDQITDALTKPKE